MKQVFEVGLSLLVALALIFFALAAPKFLDQNQTAIAANPAFSTSAASPEEYEIERRKVERFGRYQVAFDSNPGGKSIGDSDRYGQFDSASSKSFRVTYSIPSAMDSLEETSCGCEDPIGIEWNIELELMPCLPGQSVSGGTLQLQKEGQTWTLEFYQLGAEGVIYMDELPPEEIYELLQTEEGTTLGDLPTSFDFLLALDDFYSAAEAQDEELSQCKAAGLVEMMFEVLSSKFRSKENQTVASAE